MDNLNNIPSIGNFGDVADKLNDNFNKVNIAVETINSKYVRNKGYFPTLAALQAAFPSPKIGDIAYVANEASSSGYYVANVVSDAWVETTTVAPAMAINANEYAKHGYSTTPKTLKQVDDEIALLAGDYVSKSEIEFDVEGSQLFNKKIYLNNASINSEGVVYDVEGAKTTSFIFIQDNITHITFSGLTAGATRRIAWYSENKDYLSLDTSSQGSATFPVPLGAKYFLLTFQVPSDPIDHAETLMINYGQNALPYENFISTLKGIEGVSVKKDYLTDQTMQKISGSISVNDLNIVPGNQLFDKVNAVMSGYFIAADGSLGANETTENARTTDYIGISDGETLLSWSGATPSLRRYAFYDESKTAILVDTISASSGTHTIPIGARYYRQNYRTSNDVNDYTDTLMINYGTPKAYEDYQAYVTKILGLPFVGADAETANGISQISWQYNNIDAAVTGTDLYQMFTVVPNVDGEGDTVGCTGACYNNKLEQYVISYYSFAKASKLWFYNRKDLVDYSPIGTIVPTPTRELDISSYLYHIQGVAYDQELDNYWVIGSLNAVSNNLERVLIRVDNDGNLLEKTVLSDYDFQAGMIDMSPDMQNIMIKPNDRSWVLELNKLTKNQVRQVTVLATGEGLGVDYANNEVWVGDNGTLYKYDYYTFALLSTHPFQTLSNGTVQNIEGIIIDPIDRAVIIVADAYLHGANNNGNAMWVFDFNKTIGKQVRFPQMIKWQGDESYVIDFGASNNLTPATIEDGDGELIYRGSDTAPSLTPVNRVNWRDRPYYAGWGTTTPSEWSGVMPSYQYMQIKRM